MVLFSCDCILMGVDPAFIVVVRIKNIQVANTLEIEFTCRKLEIIIPY